MSGQDPYQLFLNISAPAKPRVNACNHYLFDRIDDIVDRVPNSQIEDHYGSLTPEKINTPSEFWRTVIGPDHAQDIAVIATHNNSDAETTVKTLNFFGGLFLETQETAKAILNNLHSSDTSTLRQSLTNQNRFISWGASQLCMDITAISGDPNIDPCFRINIFDDCSKINDLEEQETLKYKYYGLFCKYSEKYTTGAFDQYKNDLRDTIKDLGIYICLYPRHVTTNTVLNHYQNNNPDKHLVGLDLHDTDIRRGSHPLYRSFMAVCHQTGIDPQSFELDKFDQAKELPEFTSLGDSPKWQQIKSETATLPGREEIILFRNSPNRSAVPKPPQAR